MNPSGSPDTQTILSPEGSTGSASTPSDSRLVRTVLIVLFCVALATHFFLATFNWRAGFLVGHEFRQTHTAIITYYLDKENRFSLHYTTPLFGKPWSVPMEFPLYEWSVVLVSRIAHVPHFEAARAVSLTCFYLTLPAVWLLLGYAGLAAPRRLLALALILVCPVYIFYSRSFLMESMVLMFSAWFLAMFVRTMQERRLRWLVLCATAGAGAGLIKSTTFFVWLLPAALYGAWFLGRSLRPWSGWKPVARTLAWSVGAALVPCSLTYWWVKYTDAIKAPHPSAHIFASSELTQGSFGLYSLAARFSPAIWRALMADWQLTVMSPWIIGLFVVAGALFFHRVRWQILGATGFFLAAQVLFPTAYAYQDYYFYACAVFLLVALGLVLHGVLDSGLPPWIRWTIVIVPLAAMLGSYRWGYYSGLPIPFPPSGKPSAFYGGRDTTPEHYQWGYFWGQAVGSKGGSGLADALRTWTPENSVIIVAGNDWAPMIPYYSKRKALMIRNGLQYDQPYLIRAFNDLDDEDVSALVVVEAERGDKALIQRAAAKFGLDTSVTFSSPFADVYLSGIYRTGAVVRLQGNHGFHQVTSQAKPDWPVSPSSRPFAITPGVAADAFKMVSPHPTQFRFAYGYSLMELNGTPILSAHPDSDLWVPAPAGARQIVWEFGIVPGAYERDGDKTNGVEFVVEGESADGSRRRIFHRLLDPAAVPGDRGSQRAEIPYQPVPGEKLVFLTRPNGGYAFDWAYWTRIAVK
jgi:hypothetical protein